MSQSIAILAAAAEAKTQKRSTLVSHNVIISGHRTSVRLEPEMWDSLREMCRRERTTLHQMCTSAGLGKNEKTSLTAAIRVFIMRYFCDAATEDGHSKAGHGYGLAIGLTTGVSGIERRQMATLTKTSFY